MTKLSLENLKVANQVKIHTATAGWLVAVERNGNRAYLSDADGPLAYPSQALARRAIRRVRPDLEPTEI